MKEKLTLRAKISSGILSRFTIALVCFALLNFALWKTQAFGLFSTKKTVKTLVSQSHDMAKTWPWWIATNYLKETTRPDVLILGDSQMATAIFTADAKASGNTVDVVSHRHVATLEETLSKKLSMPVSVFNAALAGSVASDFNLLARGLFLDRTDALKPKLVVIGISPRVFIDNTLPEASSTEQFKFFTQCVDPGKLSQFAFADYFGQMNWFINKRLPMAKLKSELQAHLPAQLDKAKKKNPKGTDFMKGMFASASKVEANEWFVPANMPYLFKDNTQEYVLRYTNPDPPLYAGELAFFGDLLQRLDKAGIPTLVVGMPSMAPNRSLLPANFWKIYRANINTLCTTNNAKFVDLSDSPDFVIDDYLDTVHLNSRGGLRLITTLSSLIINNQELVATFHGTAIADKASTHL